MLRHLRKRLEKRGRDFASTVWPNRAVGQLLRIFRAVRPYFSALTGIGKQPKMADRVFLRLTTMTWNGNSEESQRRLLIEALAAALLSTVIGSPKVSAQVLGSRPAPLPKGKSIYRIEGQVLVDGQPATTDTRIAANSTIQTGKDGAVIYAVGETAHLQRSESQVTIETKEANSMVVSGLRVLTGKILSVFPSGRPVRMTTRNASIGIRGTGTYMESDPEQTYFCTCYGTADIASASDPASRETVVSTHHNRPLYILTGEQPGRNIRPAPFIDHTDQELMLIEALVGRTPPFVFPKDEYNRPRRRTY